MVLEIDSFTDERGGKEKDEEKQAREWGREREGEVDYSSFLWLIYALVSLLTCFGTLQD